MKTLAELDAPAVVQRRLLEKDVQKQCVDWARARGYWARKFSSMTSTAEPDYLFSKECINPNMCEHQVVFAAEFKAPGKTSTEAQLEEQELMKVAGWIVFECDDFEKFKRTVRAIENGVFMP